jgi:patatin-like phospholipase/acyl hydrolase
MDGGGMKGMAMVELLRQLERRAGAPIWSLFDVIGGTSTGGLLAVATGILRLPLDECQDIYTKLGNKVWATVPPASLRAKSHPV